MGCVGHVARTKKCAQSFGGGILSERDDLENLGVDGRIILKCILRKWVRREWNALVWFREGEKGGLL
jgi:hypothetical protein